MWNMYRIWDKLNKTYCGKEYFVRNNGKVFYFSLMGAYEDFNNQDNYIIQRATGLKDKNGVEIYEGDKVLLTFFEYFSNECISIDENGTFKGVVKYNIGAFFVEDKDKTWIFLGNVFDEAHLEIIGNIMEVK